MRAGNTLFSLAIALLFCLPINAQQIGLDLAKSHLQQEVQQGKYAPADLQNPLVTDHYTSNGITHVYFRQTLNGIEIANANASVHIVNGNVLTSNSQFLPALEKRNVQGQATLSAIDAIIKVSEQKSYPLNRNELKAVKNKDRSASKAAIYSAPSISHADIPARMVYIADKNGSLNLAWDIAIDEVVGEDYMNYVVDARTGKIRQAISWTTHCNFGDGHVHTEDCTSHAHADKNSLEEEFNSLLVPNTYNVFEVPVESPNFGGRSIVTAPWLANPTASPDQWHRINGTNYTVTRGNNVDCYLDNDDSNSPTGGDAARVDGGANLEFDFPWVDDSNPTAYQDAALTNLFYWSNLTHDIWYNYGFDEASGNFQENNFGQGGQGSDSVNGEAQDGSGTCNANFSTPPDGSNPRMQMYLCNGRDGDYDNGVVVHEIGHGISIRLTGGASNSGCLSGSEQMGEGWSDYFGIVMTIEPGDQASDARPMGTYLFGQGPNGGGIRPFPYSTDLNVNPMTYATIGSGVSVPHGVGSVWATMLWDMTWDLIAVYGWDPDLYSGTGGNNIAMQLVIEGLKLQPCGPGFVDGRDAILAADQALNGGANQCLIWESFARRGLGFSANQGSSASNTDGTESFDLPPSCSIGLDKTANITQVTPGGNITYTLTATNNTGATLNNVVISDDLPANTSWVSGGSLSGNIVNFPGVSLANNATHTVSFTVQVDGGLNGNIVDFNDNMEGGAVNWVTDNSGASFWNLQSGTANSGSNAWFAEDVGTTSVANLIVATEKGLTSSSVLTFAHNYNTEATWDGGVVEISTDNGTSWSDLGNDMTANGYNSTINNSRPAFSGNSGGFVTTSVNLSAYAGQNALIRFQMNCDVTVSGLGWYVDDVTMNNLALYIPNIASVTDGNLISQGGLQTPTLVIGGSSGPLGVTVSSTNIDCNGNNNGTASAIGTGGDGSYTYAWSNGQNTATINGLGAGTYTVTVNDGSTTATGSVTISEPTALTVTTTSNPANNGNNGTATATANGGTPSYSYTWDNGGSTATITGLAPGDYIVTATDANNCTVTSTVTVQDNNVPSYCNTQGTNQNFEFIDAVVLDAMNNVSGDDGGYGDYTSIVTDFEQGATANVTLTPGFTGQAYQEVFRIWIDYNQDLDFEDVGEEVFAPASSDVAISGTFVIPNGALLGTTRMRVSMKYNGAPPICGDFSDGEAEDYTINITQPAANPITLVVTGTDLDCFDINNGTATATASDGTGNFTYSWSNGGNTATIDNLTAGTYTVTVMDGVSTEVGSVTINEPAEIVISINGGDISCNDSNDGVATANVTGGTGTIDYNWSNGGTSATIDGLSAGTYTLTVTDENGCLATGSVMINDAAPFTLSVFGENVSCNGTNDGDASVNVSGGNDPIVYSWSNGDSGATISNLVAGTYDVTATDDAGCIATGSVTINEPDAITITASGTNVTCSGAADGTGTATATGGTGAISYEWSDQQIGATATNLAPGSYLVTAFDESGCSAFTTVTISEPNPISISITSTNASCNADNGSAIANAAGGTSPFSYTWSTGAMTATIDNLAAGVYTVTATDDTGCTSSEDVTISSPFGLSVTASSTDVTCNGLNDGAAFATISGGNGNVSYTWNGVSSGADLTNIPAGTYTVIATDGAGCMAEATVTVSEPAAISLAVLSENTSCGAADGSTVAEVSGGVNPFSFDWSNGETTQNIDNLPAGTYSVTIIDANGCIETGSTTIASPFSLTVTASSINASCNGLNDGAAFAIISGGNGNVSYTWNGVSGGANLNDIPAGTYTVVATDGAGCMAEATVTVSEPSAIIATANGMDANGGDNGSATASAQGGNPPYNYAWSNGGNTATITGLAPGDYEVMVSDANGCIATATVTINDNTPPPTEYCGSEGLNTNYEFIESVAVDGDVNASGNNNGYADFTGYVFELEQGGDHDFLLTPGFASSTYTENWKIWIDFNGDSDFDDAGEEVFAGSSNAAIAASISIPTDVSFGQTRMRISMQWGATPTPCSTFNYGEVEDYTVDILESGTGGGCTFSVIDSENFESGWGIWNDGGSDARRSANDAPYANSGNYCVRLRDNTSTSTMTTDVLNLSAYEELTVDFSYITRSMDNANEDFWLQISNNGGASFITVEEWNRGDEFENGQRESDVVTIGGPFSANTVIRFRCDASGNADWVYIDDVVISGCATASNLLANAPIIDKNKYKAHNEVADREDDNLDNEDYILDTPNELKIFPNPVNNQLTIAYQFAEMHDTKLIITDFTGRILQQLDTPAGAHQTRVDVSNFTPGYYLVRVISGDQQMSEKFAVVR
ncbi:MAG: putative repeat protein (TIGR01451 family) [Saprospiraceae bacterium]|jgi:uncharacterized repeat protein (TIGR01451 family)